MTHFWFSYAAYGNFNLRTKETGTALLKRLSSSTATRPTKWTVHDGGALHEFDASEVANTIARLPAESEVFLSGLECDGTATMSLSRWPRLSTQSSKIVSSESICAWFADTSAISDVLRADISVACCGASGPSSDGEKGAWSDVQRDMERLSTSIPVYNEYYRIGPCGIGMRTVFGPHYVNQFGRSLLLDTPVCVSELDWGGIQLDLVREPWRASTVELVSAWRRGMEHLVPVGIFADVEIDEDERFVDYVRKGPNVVIGGVLPKES